MSASPKPGDIVASEHWGQSGFANTELDFRLKQGSPDVIVVGLLANSCIESAVRNGCVVSYCHCGNKNGGRLFRPRHRSCDR